MGLDLHLKACDDSPMQGAMKNVGYREHPRAYTSWTTMKRRCLDRLHPYYHKYKDVPICDRWRQRGGFWNFLEDMGDPPPGHTLERIKNELGYEKSNCRWATRIEQAINRSSTHFLTFRGETLPFKHMAVKYGMSQNNLRIRLSQGMSLEEALTKPTDSRRGKRR